MQPNSEWFQQGSRTVPVFRGVLHFRVASPRSQRLKPNRFAVGNISQQMQHESRSTKTLLININLTIAQTIAHFFFGGLRNLHVAGHIPEVCVCGQEVTEAHRKHRTGLLAHVVGS